MSSHKTAGIITLNQFRKQNEECAMHGHLKTALVGLWIGASLMHQAAAAEPQLLISKFHADWCGSCKVLEEPFAQLKQRFGEAPVLFLVFDFTDATRTHQSQLLAAALGMQDILNDYPGTGFMLLIDPANQTIMRLTVDQSFDAMAAAVQKALDAQPKE
jgi:thiol-disulfide isomerase/thioredoxin